jgi:hypothetical protein
MPLKMNPNQTDDYFIVADAALTPTQTLSVVSADPNTVLLTPDAVVRNFPGTAPDPTENVTIGSGKVGVGPTPVLRTPINCTASVADTDPNGTPLAPQTDTCEFDPKVATKIGELFGTPTP